MIFSSFCISKVVKSAAKFLKICSYIRMCFFLLFAYRDTAHYMYLIQSLFSEEIPIFNEEEGSAILDYVSQKRKGIKKF